MINLQHHGATSGVTGSCHELTLGQGTQKRGASASDLSIDFPDRKSVV